MSLTDFLFHFELPRAIVTVKSSIFLIFLCLTVIFSYALHLLSERWRLPSVLLLIATGLVLRGVCWHFRILVMDLDQALSFFGTLGLILIVLEAAMDLELTREHRAVIVGTTKLSLAILAACALPLAFAFMFMHAAPFGVALENAVPFAVMSSAVVIPSLAHLAPPKREFMIYLATFSDVLGVLLFNFVVVANEADYLLHTLAGNLFLTVLFSIALSSLLVYVFAKIATHAKFFLMIALITLLYTLGKLAHLSPLLMVFLFGLVINNPRLFLLLPVRAQIDLPDLDRSVRDFKVILLEFTFFVKTVFFILFGMSIDPAGFLNAATLATAALVLAVLYAAQYISFARLAPPERRRPEWLLAPRGLISALLFLSIEPARRIAAIDSSVLSVVIIVSGVIMSVALMRAAHPCAGRAAPAPPSPGVVE